MLRILGLLGFAATAAAATTVTDCAPGTSVFTINSASLDPTDPAPGETFLLNLDYTVPAGVTVTDGVTTYDVTYNYIPFDPTTNPLCQDIPCPLGPGDYTNATKSTWPSGLSGYITSKMTWKSADSTLLLCLEIAGMIQQLRLAAPPAFAALPAPQLPNVTTAPQEPPLPQRLRAAGKTRARV